ncbi:hypothetical protein [Cryptosporangium sp. NPDC048952]|uniref:hypothetical protein n=1 Tax=Cryptosporangium sp. NPDC048952 TaxID=3363961 RepID=UPI00371F2BB0
MPRVRSDELLLRIVRDAVALQPVADDALAALSAAPERVGIWARAASRVAGRYWEMLQELTPDTPDRRRVAELLGYHERILRHTIRFACSLDHVADRQVLSTRQASTGLGEPGAELRRMLKELDAESAADG